MLKFVMKILSYTNFAVITMPESLFKPIFWT